MDRLANEHTAQASLPEGVDMTIKRKGAEALLRSAPFLMEAPGWPVLWLSYGSRTRNEVEYDPPAYVPPAVTTDPLPETPADDGKLAVAVMAPPGWMGPSDCGNEDPVAAPSVADSNLTYCAVPVPLFFKLITT